MLLARRGRSQLRGWPAALAGALWLLAGEGRTSYHGTVAKEYPGLTVTVGYRDHGDQPGGRSLDETRASARRRLEAGAPRVQKLYVHFATAAHGHRRLRALLATDSKAARERGFAVQVQGEDGSTLDGFVHLRAEPAGSVAAKLAYDFAFSQLAPGGAAATPGHEEDADVTAPLEACLAFDPEPATVAGEEPLVEALRRSEASLRAVAAAPDLSGDAARGQWAARAYVAAFDGKPFSRELLARLGSFEPAERTRGLKLLVLLLDDARWESGVAAVRARAKGDAVFAAWLAPLLEGAAPAGAPPSPR